MELAQAKLPFLPPEWTVARVVGYAAKLTVFVIVPGLHQIASNRRILSGLLMVLYFGTEFTLSNKPIEATDASVHLFILKSNLPETFLYFSWFLLALDLKKLGKRTLKISGFLVLSCAAGLYFIPHHRPMSIYGYIEQENYACPTFCKYDFIEYEPRWRQKGDLSEGDFVIFGEFEGPYYASKLLAGPLKNYLPGTVKKLCAGYGDADELQRAKKSSCEASLKEKLNYFLILGGPKPEFKDEDGRRASMVSSYEIRGASPRKIGNTHEYFIVTDEITDIIGNALLTVYKWTGINFFGMSRLIQSK